MNKEKSITTADIRINQIYIVQQLQQKLVTGINNGASSNDLAFLSDALKTNYETLQSLDLQKTEED